MWSKLGQRIVAWLERVQRRRYKRKRCPHGMPGGLSRGLCSECKVEAEQARRARARQADQQRKRAQELERRRREEHERAEHERLAREHAERQRREAAEQAAADLARRREIKVRAAELRKRELARARRTRLRKLSTLRDMHSRAFEAAVAELYSRLGYHAEVTAAVSDLGADVIATREGRRWVIECKRYAGSQVVGRDPLQKLVSAMQEYDAHAAICVTTSRFSGPAMAFARKRNIELVDGERLLALLARAYPPTAEDAHFDVMCEECGVTMRFALRDDTFNRRCPNGHAVICDFRTPLIDESKGANARHKSQEGRPRRRRP